MLIYEGQEAWTHYRHVENERNQYLGFFFTATLAGAGITIAALPEADGEKWQWFVVGASLLATVLVVLGFLILTSLARFGSVLEFYTSVIKEQRADLLREFSPSEAQIKKRGLPRDEATLPNAHWIPGAQTAAELAVAFLQLAFAAGPLIAVGTLWTESYSTPQAIVLGLCALIVLPLLAAPVGVMRPVLARRLRGRDRLHIPERGT